MPAADRLVNGLLCSDVLGLLPSFVEGEVDPDTTHQIQGHLAGCDVCERFGGRYVHVLQRLKAQPAPSAPSDLYDRLLNRLHQG